MNKTKISLVVCSVAIVSLAVAAVTANPSINTPLYTLRMEQASSKMNFLPTAVNDFTYTAEKGSTLNYNVSKYCSFVVPLAPTGSGGGETCWPQCNTTQPTCSTCEETCPSTCSNTCSSTCPNTCPVTCITCETCEGPTCENTCQPTCPWTCWQDCEYTKVFPTCNWVTCNGC